jgi:hypothetical protein
MQQAEPPIERLAEGVDGLHPSVDFLLAYIASFLVAGSAVFAISRSAQHSPSD